MSDSEILKSFDETRNAFSPYGFTCELWTPSLMGRPDRHNEIEINFCPNGTITYLIQGKKVTLPSKRLAIFWGLVPHQIVNHDSSLPYFVCTIPFSQFLGWKLPKAFTDTLLNGDVLVETSEDPSLSYHDEYLLSSWVEDVHRSDIEVIILEMHARIKRMANRFSKEMKSVESNIYKKDINAVEQMVIFIARNYAKPLKVADIGKAVDLHPDHANFLFKQSFGRTLGEYITQERIAHAQRKMISSADMSITEIAFNCGFNSISRFNAAFRKLNNCTPREFKRVMNGS